MPRTGTPNPSARFVDALHRVALFEPQAHSAIQRALQLAAAATHARVALLRIGAAGRHIVRTHVAADCGLDPQIATQHIERLGSLSVDGPIAIGNLAEWAPQDADFATGMLVAVPIAVPGESSFGTLAVYDPTPRMCGDEEQAALRLVAATLLSELKLRVIAANRRQRAAHLSSQKRVLRRIAAAAPLPRFMRALAAHVEQQSAGALCVVTLTSRSGRIHRVASPAMPESFLHLLRDADPTELPTRTAGAVAGIPLVITDFRSTSDDSVIARAARKQGFHACWSLPVSARSGYSARIDVYRVTPGEPEQNDRELLAVSAAMARIALERQHSEARLRRSEEYFRSLIENSSDFIMVLDGAGRAKYVSPMVARELGLETSAAATIYDLAMDTDRARMRDLLESLEDGREISFDLELRDRTGKVRKLEATATNLLTTAAVRGVVINARDVTERKSIEDKLRQSQRLEAIGQLAGGVAHDFNNLLTVISGFAALLEEEESLSADVAEGLAEIGRASERGAALTRQLLAFSRRQVLQPRQIMPNTVVTGLQGMLRRLIGEHIQIEQRLSANIGAVFMDPGQLEQVLINLAVNARDAMPHGGVLSIETALCDQLPQDVVRSHEKSDAQYVRFTVADTGCGMDEQVLARVFEPFFTTKGVGRGTGLGLATVYGIVEQSGGHVRIQSQVDIGTTVDVFLPVDANTATDIGPDHADAQSISGTESILVVEDDPSVRELVPRLLKRAGFHVEVAPDGAAAMRLLQTTNYKPDLLLTDVVLPGMSGRVVADQVQATVPDVGVVFMSGYTASELGHYGVLDSNLAFVQKPFSRGSLLRVVRDSLDQRLQLASVGAGIEERWAA